MKVKDIAAMEGITPSQAGKSIHAALRRLRRYFARQKWTVNLWVFPKKRGAWHERKNYYARLGIELRYPLMLETSTNIYVLGFLEAGNAWHDISKFNPFDLKRSAGVGVRIFLPMIGMMGLDWGYGFDKINGSKEYGGSQFHFILGQEF